jgi:hypothetical protein
MLRNSSPSPEDPRVKRTHKLLWEGIVNLGTELNNMLKYLHENEQHCSQLQRLPLSA